MKPDKWIEHPEGGRFCEVFRSHSRVHRSDGSQRTALTHIYFSLSGHDVSHFHKVNSDEVWNLYRGNGLCIYLWDGSAPLVIQVELSEASGQYCHVVPKGVWQAAVPIGGDVLVGCSVAPGFEFADFEILKTGSDEAGLLCASQPDLKKLIMSA